MLHLAVSDLAEQVAADPTFKPRLLGFVIDRRFVLILMTSLTVPLRIAFKAFKHQLPSWIRLLFGFIGW